MNKLIEIPTYCPECLSTLELVNMQLFCKNIFCSARTSKNIEHFAKTVGIKGLGEKTIEKLHLDHFCFLYHLSVASLTDLIGSETLATKIHAEIEKSKNVDLCTLISALGIPLVGKTIACKLTGISNINMITTEYCKSVGIGEKATANLVEYLSTEYLEIKPYLPFSCLDNNQPVQSKVAVSGKTICITGKLKSFKGKAEATKALEESGFRVVDSVTKDTNLLVDEENKGSTKRVKAEKLGIQIVDNLLTFLKQEI